MHANYRLWIGSILYSPSDQRLLCEGDLRLFHPEEHSLHGLISHQHTLSKNTLSFLHFQHPPHFATGDRPPLAPINCLTRSAGSASTRVTTKCSKMSTSTATSTIRTYATTSTTRTDDSDFLTIHDNEVYGNGYHGIIASKRCNGVSIQVRSG